MEDLEKRNKIVQKTIEDILNDRNNNYTNFLHKLNKFLNEVNNDCLKADNDCNNM